MGKINIFFITLIKSALCIFLFFSACRNNRSSDKANIRHAMSIAGENEGELQKAIRYYSKSPKDSLKLKALEFLLTNMENHSYRSGSIIDSFRIKLMSESVPISTKKVNSIWNECVNNISDTVTLKYDIQEIQAEFLIDNIEGAFDSWESAPWKAQINFADFCRYILPYRVLNEDLKPNWRSNLKSRYQPFIEGISDPKVAFTIIYRQVQNSQRLANSNCPYNLDVLAIDNIKRGNCSQICILTIAVLRALGIPSSYDFLTNWANYSIGGHSWVSYIDQGGEVFTLAEGDSVIRKNNPIDASSFPEPYIPPNYPIPVSQQKTVAKIYRRTYNYCQPVDKLNKDLFVFEDHHNIDISQQYGLKGTITLEADSSIEKVSLSTYLSGLDWTEFIFMEKKSGKVTFEHLGTDIVYLPKFYKRDGTIITGHPFILTPTGETKELVPREERYDRITFYRKYPLFTRWTTIWKKMVGGKFQGANEPGFRHPTLLYEIQKTPSGMIEALVNNKGESFRYVRYVCPEKCRTPLAEVAFFDDTSKSVKTLSGKYIFHKINKDTVGFAFDGDRLSVAATNQEAFWLGLDFGKNNAKIVKKIKFIPKNDGNFIEPNHYYELFYYDKGWKPVDIKRAETDSIDFTGVKKNALYLLKDHTGGVEERIFTYENNRQIWW